MEQYEEFHQCLLEWYNENRREFYWRTDDLTPFELLLTELLLKRTKAETVDNYAKEVLDRLSTPRDVVEIDQESLVDLLNPFGLYNRRSKNIKSVCRDLVEKHSGEVPTSREKLMNINGIGQYTADSIRCFAFDIPTVIIDTNTIVVAEHFFGVSPADDPRQDTRVRPVLNPLLDYGCVQHTNWALLDLGADMIANDKTAEDYSIPEMSVGNVP